MGYECLVWEFPKSKMKKLWTYQGIPLKSEKTVAGILINATAVEVELDIPSEKGYFEVDSFQWKTRP